ncbi:MAG: pro-sigmaK processing inhibitor BofA family protein [Lachnospirales bacterium]
MFELNSQLIIAWVILGAFFFIMALLFNGFKMARSFFWRGLMGISAILVANYMLQGYGIILGINLFTGFVAGLLGMPGVAMMYCLNYFMI